MKLLPADTVRGAVQRFIAQHLYKLGDNVLEVGSRMPDGAGDWANNRLLAAPGVHWIGVDIQEGRGVDRLADAQRLPFGVESFTGALCSEVLEHVEEPHRVVRELARVVRPGGYVLITTPFAFPIHAYPVDYFRFTPEGLKMLMKRAGLVIEEGETAGRVDFRLNDHGTKVVNLHGPRHVFALGQKPQ